MIYLTRIIIWTRDIFSWKVPQLLATEFLFSLVDVKPWLCEWNWLLVLVSFIWGWKMRCCVNIFASVIWGCRNDYFLSLLHALLLKNNCTQSEQYGWLGGLRPATHIPILKLNKSPKCFETIISLHPQSYDIQSTSIMNSRSRKGNYLKTGFCPFRARAHTRAFDLI